MPELLWLADGEFRTPLPLPPAFAQWRAQGGAELSFAPDDEFAALVGALPQLALIALDFPQAGDGRPYSLAALLRHTHGWRGELRAAGAVQIDQLHWLRRVGFDSVATPASWRSGAAQRAIATVLARFSDAYQAALDQPLPVYRRHRRPAAGEALKPPLPCVATAAARAFLFDRVRRDGAALPTPPRSPAAAEEGGRAAAG
jgi:uncharacterized protein (DUF934 family)